MKLHHTIRCPQCSGENFTAKYESTYIYSYKIEPPENQDNNHENHTLPFLFDDREQKSSKQYIECDDCGAKYSCEFTLGSKQLDFTIVKKAIHSKYTERPEFWG